MIDRAQNVVHVTRGQYRLPLGHPAPDRCKIGLAQLPVSLRLDLAVLDPLHAVGTFLHNTTASNRYFRIVG